MTKPTLSVVNNDLAETEAGLELPATPVRPLEIIRQDLILAIEAEKQAKEARMEIEAEILAHPDVISTLKEEGTTKVDGLSFSTGFTRSWNQGRLMAVRENIKPEYWPFKTIYQEIRKDSDYIERNFPDLWKTLAGALTLTPKKPAIKPFEAK